MTRRSTTPEKSPRVSVQRWYLSNLAANLVLAALGIATGLLAARLLGPQGRGELAAIQLIANTLSGVALLGLGDSLAYFSSREPDRRATYASTSVLIASAVSLPFILLGYVAIPAVLSGYANEVVVAAQIYLLYLLINALVGLPYQALRGAEHFRAWNVLRVLPAGSWLVLLLAAWSLGKRQSDWLALMYLVIIAGLVIPVWATVIGLVRGRFTPRFAACGPLIRYGLPSSISAVPQIITSRVDQIVVAATLAPEALGFYAVALACSGLASPLTSALSALVLPFVAQQSQEEERTRVFSKAVRTGVFVGLIAGVLVACVTPIILPLLFGSSFRPAVPAALILAAAAAVAAVNGVLEEGFRGLGRPGFVLRAHLVGAVVGTVLVIALVREYAMIGAAFASLLGAVTVAVVFLLQARFFLGIRLNHMLVLRGGEFAQLVRGGAAACARAINVFRSGG